MQHNPANLLWLTDTEAAADVLAAVAVEARRVKAAAALKAAADKRAESPGMWETAQKTVNDYFTQPVGKYVGSEGAKHLGYGLLGAGLGAGAGLATQAFADKRRRKPLSSILAGGLLGGALGAGGSVVHSHWGDITGFGGSTPQERQQEINNMQADATTAGRMYPHSEELDAAAKKHMISPETMRDLALARQRNGPAAYAAFLQHAARNKGNAYGSFSLPSNHAKSKALADAGLEHTIGGISASDLRYISEGQGAEGGQNTEQAKSDLVRKVLASYAQGGKPVMRQIPGGLGSPAKYEKWTEQSLRKELPALMEEANAGNRNYYWSADDKLKDDMATILDEFSQKAQDTGMVPNRNFLGGYTRNVPVVGADWAPVRNDVWTRGSQAANRVRKNDYAGAAGLAAKTVGLGHYVGASQPNEGLFKEISRAGTPDVALSIEDVNGPRFRAIRDRGLNPIELLEAYRGGPNAIAQLKERILREGREYAKGVKWTPERLDESLPGYMTEARDQAGATGILTALENIPSPSKNLTGTPSAGLDMAMLTGGLDAGMTGIQRLRNFMTGYNPADIVKLIKQHGSTLAAPDKFTQAEWDYVRHVYDNFGEKGLRELKANPQKFIGTHGKATWNPPGETLRGSHVQGAADATTAALEKAHKAEVAAMQKGYAAAQKAVPTDLQLLTKRVRELIGSGGSGMTAQQLNGLNQALSRIAQLPPESQQAALDSLLQSGNLPGGVSFDGNAVKALGKPTQAPFTPPAFSAPATPQLASELSKAIGRGEYAALMSGKAHEYLRSLPEVERTVLLNDALTKPGFSKHLPEAVALDLKKLQTMASLGKQAPRSTLSMLGLGRFGGGLIGKVPRTLGYMALPLAYEYGIEAGRPGPDRVEHMLAEMAKKHPGGQ